MRLSGCLLLKPTMHGERRPMAPFALAGKSLINNRQMNNLSLHASKSWLTMLRWKRK